MRSKSSACPQAEVSATVAPCAKDAYGRTRVAFSARTDIERHWNVSWNMALETGGLLVGKRVQIELEVQALPAALVQTG
jgi:polyisoprenoid-binding protein YceI